MAVVWCIGGAKTKKGFWPFLERHEDVEEARVTARLNFRPPRDALEAPGARFGRAVRYLVL